MFKNPPLSRNGLHLWKYFIVLHEEVVRLDVPVDEVLAVDIFDPRDQLVRQQQHCLQAKPPAKKKRSQN